MDGICNGWWVIADVSDEDAELLREVDEHGEWTQKYVIGWDELSERHAPFRFERQSGPEHCGDPVHARDPLTPGR